MVGWLDRSGRLLTALTFLGSIVFITITMKEVSYHGDEDDIDDDEDGEDDDGDDGDDVDDEGGFDDDGGSSLNAGACTSMTRWPGHAPTNTLDSYLCE